MTWSNHQKAKVDRFSRLKVRLHRVKGRLLEIPALRLIVNTADGSGRHDATQRAAGVAYYSILSIFPLLLGLIAVFGFFLPSGNLQEELLTFVSNNLPGASEILTQNIESIVNLRGAMSALSVIILFWGASAIFSAISLAVNRAYDIVIFRPFFIRKARELAMLLGTGILFILSMGAGAIMSILRRVAGFDPANLVVLEMVSRVAAFLLILVVFLLLYKLLPNTRTYWRFVWPRALLAAVFFEIARTLFVFYLANFANYHLIYGSIASIIALLIWIYYSAFILIMGAEFSFQYSRLRSSPPASTTLPKQ